MRLGTVVLLMCGGAIFIACGSVECIGLTAVNVAVGSIACGVVAFLLICDAIRRRRRRHNVRRRRCE